MENADTLFTSDYERGDVLRIPIAHGEGNYEADEDTLERLEGEGRVVFRYVDATGAATDAANPNGSLHNIAGIVNERRQRAGHDAPPGAGHGAAPRLLRRRGRLHVAVEEPGARDPLSTDRETCHPEKADPS